jgi:hypothetical protein
MSRPTALETGEPRVAARRLTTMTPRLATLAAVLVVLAASVRFGSRCQRRARPLDPEHR